MYIATVQIQIDIETQVILTLTLDDISGYVDAMREAMYQTNKRYDRDSVQIKSVQITQV